VWGVAAFASTAVVLAIAAGAAPSWYMLASSIATTLIAIFAGPLVDRRRAPLDATLELLPGAVVVRDASGRVRSTITARSVIGATTARLPEGISLVLALKPEASVPAVLRLKDEAEADEVRRALGVGPGGFGVAQWPIGPARYGAFRGLFRFGWRALLASMVFATVLFDHPTVFHAFIGQAVLYVGLAALVMRVTQGTEPPWIQLSPRGVAGHARMAGNSAEVQVPFAAIRHANVDAVGNIVLDCAPPFGEIVFESGRARGIRRVDDEERLHITAQIQAAADRAKQPSFHAEKTSRLELLRRGEDTWIAWLARLDGIGRSLRGAHDYRAIALDDRELWNALETPDMDAELRTAAARVLAQADGGGAANDKEGETKKRILATLSAERDPAAMKRIRVALEPDAEVAVREFEELERRGAERRR
jgi:hypothetical protein